MAEVDNNTNNGLPEGFRIKTLEELNQKHNQYEGMITYFRKDGVIPEPMKSVEELNKVREKAPIYYGRSGEKYGSNVHLEPEAKKYVKVDENGTVPVKDTTDTSDLGTGFYSNGLNEEYLSSLIEDEDITNEDANEEDTEVVDGLSEAQLRIQQSIFGDFSFEEEKPKKRVQTQPTVNPYVSPESVAKPANTVRQTISESSAAPREAEQAAKAPLRGAAASGTSPAGNTPPRTSSARVGRAQLIQRQLLEQQLGISPVGNAQTQGGNSVNINQQTPLPQGMVMSRASYVKAMSSGSGNNTVSGTAEPRIVKEKQEVTFADVVKNLFMYAICVVIAMVLAVVIVRYVGQKTEVHGSSMNDTLVDGQQLIIDKISYRSHEPERYDVIVFPENERSNYVKRIIGLPGETVSVAEGFIYINGELLSDDIYGKEAISPSNYYLLEQPVKLGSDEYFVLGDNRNNSTDSRDPEVGNIPRERIIGKVIFRIWPLKDIGKVE